MTDPETGRMPDDATTPPADPVVRTSEPRWTIARRVGWLLLGAVGAAGIFALIWFVAFANRDTPSADSSPKVVQPAGYAFSECRQCHADLDRSIRTGSTKNLIFSHVTHFQKTIGDCATCHTAVTHLPDKTLTPSMQRCYQCHGTTKASTASGRCLTCHPANSLSKPDSHLIAGWSSGRHASLAKADRASCLSCHEEKTFCAGCHAGGKPASHGLPGWSTGAHETLAKANRAQCLTCHSEATFCAGCHAKSKPSSHNIPGWSTGAHETLAKANRAQCLTCHSEATFCAGCHAKSKPSSHNIPGWSTGAHEKLAEQNRAQCLTCHNQATFCSRCHGSDDD